MFRGLRHDPIRRATVTHRGALVSILGLVLLSAALQPWAAATSATLTDQALIDALRGGGYTLYFRHTATDWSQSDQVRQEGDWLSCDPSRMRQLSAEGRRSARAIGDAIRALGIPVGKLLASPYCRTMETARLMDIGPVEASADVMNLRAAEYYGGRDAIIATARTRLAKPPDTATNTVIVAHGNVAREATPVYPGEGEGVVFRPDGRGGFHFVARIAVVDWKRLVDAGTK
jgi:phosphohistidine phosphatase SixA